MKDKLRNRKFIQFLAVTYSLLMLTSASAQNEWIPVGPADIVIHDFTAVDSQLYASTNGDSGAVFYTENLGDDWTEISELLPGDQTPIIDLATHDLDIFAAAQFRGLYVRRWGFPVWVKIPVMSDLQSIQSILFAGEPWNRTFLGGSRLKVTAGVSMAEGTQDWISVNEGLPLSGSVHTLMALDSAVYAGTDVGVYRLDFGSDTWVSSSLDVTQYIRVNELAQNGNYLFAGTDHGVFRSSDGQNWEEMNVGLHTAATDYNAFAFDGVNTFVGSSGQFGGVYHSNNDGDNWVKIHEGFPDDISIHALMVHGPYLFSGTEVHGVYRRELLVTAVNDNTMAPSFNVYPNPNDGQFKIHIGHHQSLTGRIILTDILGRHVYETPFSCDSGNCDINVQLDEGLSGLYFLRLKGEDYDHGSKMIIR